MWKTIIAAYDGSDYSKKALKKAETVALQNQSKLIIVNVYREFVTQSFSLDLLEEAKKNISSDVDANTISSRNTNVYEELSEIAKKYEADLIIVGSRGMGETKSLLLGSVSHAVATNAQLDVLIVRK